MKGNDFEYDRWLYLLGNCLTFSWQHYLVQGFQNKGVQDASHPLLEGFALHSSFQKVYWYQCNHDLIFLKKLKKLNSTAIICPIKRWSYVPFELWMKSSFPLPNFWWAIMYMYRICWHVLVFDMEEKATNFYGVWMNFRLLEMRC